MDRIRAWNRAADLLEASVKRWAASFIRARTKAGDRRAEARWRDVLVKTRRLQLLLRKDKD